MNQKATTRDQVENPSHDERRTMVADAYARAVTSAPGSIGECCGGAREPKGVAVKMAGYEQGELATLPEDAVVNSFGCGNPVAYSGVREGDVVVDLGSGAGIDLLLAAGKVGPAGRVIGIDMTDAMIARARDNIAAAGATNVEVRTGVIENMPIESASVDWVISNCVINLSPEKDRVFAEIARVLKPGGRMLVSDIVVDDVPDSIRNDPALYCACVAGAISEDDYVKGLEDAGLVDVEILDRVHYTAAQLRGIVESESVRDSTKPSCGCDAPAASSDGSAIDPAWADTMWSATIRAQKPA